MLPKVLSDQSILFFSLPRHDADFTSTPWQLAEQFSKTNRVYFADNPFTLAELLMCFRTKAIQQRLKAYFTKPYFIKSGVIVIHMPFTLPINFLPKGKMYQWALGINMWLVAKRINACLQSFGETELVYINSFNFYYPQLQNKISTSILKNIYHCIDPIIKTYSKKHGVLLQEQAASHADAIVCTAEALMPQFQFKQFPKCYFIGNGVNYPLFANVRLNNNVHSWNNNEKVMGYVGNIERRIDYEFLLHVLGHLPNWKLILAGPVEKTFIPKEFFNHPQITFTGPISHHLVPQMIHSFDVAIIPFKCDEVSSGIYPLKLFEYLATGQPVVCTNFNPDILEDLNQQKLIRISSHPIEFAKHLQQASLNNSNTERSNRQRVAQEASWENRAEQFRQLLSPRF